MEEDTHRCRHCGLLTASVFHAIRHERACENRLQEEWGRYRKYRRKPALTPAELAEKGDPFKGFEEE